MEREAFATEYNGEMLLKATFPQSLPYKLRKRTTVCIPYTPISRHAGSSFCAIPIEEKIFTLF
jgi:hypothetical protein